MQHLPVNSVNYIVLNTKYIHKFIILKSEFYNIFRHKYIVRIMFHQKKKNKINLNKLVHEY